MKHPHKPYFSREVKLSKRDIVRYFLSVAAVALNEIQPSWSRDGAWLYFMSDRSGTREIWKMPSRGGQATQITRQGGFQAFESSDGRNLYYAKQQFGNGILKVPVNGGAEVMVTDKVWHNLWSLTDDGLYYFDVADQLTLLYSAPQSLAVRKLDLQRM